MSTCAQIRRSDRAVQEQRRSPAPDGFTPLQSNALARVADRESGSAVDGTTGRYDQSVLNVYGAEDDEEMDSILDALERATEDVPRSPSTLSNPTLDR